MDQWVGFEPTGSRFAGDRVASSPPKDAPLLARDTNVRIVGRVGGKVTQFCCNSLHELLVSHYVRISFVLRHVHCEGLEPSPTAWKAVMQPKHLQCMAVGFTEPVCPVLKTVLLVSKSV